MIFEKSQHILFAGDSITDAGRRDEAPPFGDGYVRKVVDLLVARYPELSLRFSNRGTSGDTTRDLLARWDKDVVAARPDCLSVFIGINDVWRHFGSTPQDAVPLAEYTSNLHKLLDSASARNSPGLILMQPYMIEPDRTDAMRAMMDQYGEAVEKLASEYGAKLVRTQAALDKALETTVPEDWAEDKVHPNGPGHALIALEFLREVGFEL